jgi:hypothetical protein
MTKLSLPLSFHVRLIREFHLVAIISCQSVPYGPVQVNAHLYPCRLQSRERIGTTVTGQQNIHLSVGQDLAGLNTRASHRVEVSRVIHCFQKNTLLIQNENVPGPTEPRIKRRIKIRSCCCNSNLQSCLPVIRIRLRRRPDPLRSIGAFPGEDGRPPCSLFLLPARNRPRFPSAETP